ncbi:MAG: long-chain fatty acid--CoA ligase [Caldilineaceae bacterium SB0661_bin_32]|uniref:Long-chain fatty acid--CoA ligase n=1 Tax=Caldilineaceae bacterium SB0661_bin_32 TaxID=2605255 RepID=A0A6B1D2S3_9CHLR|nr:long-chain fatty acid--CoA ligase [Caldilineaceae bacterium SB0661_bin_32]
MLSGLMMDYQLTIDRVLEHGNRLYPYKKVKTKLPDGTLHEYSYRDLYGRVKRLCNVLEGLGVQPGDRVGTFAWNNYQHVELYFGAPGAGAVVHTLNVRLFPDQLAYIINHAEDKVIFIDATLLPLMEGLGEKISGVEHFVLFNGPEGGAAANLPGQVHSYETLMAAAEDEYVWQVEGENQAMGLCYTSGTTGHPKGALYSHRSMYLHTVGSCQAAAVGLTENDVVMPVVPQFHAMAWGLPYAAVNVGADLVMPGPHMQPAALAEMIEAERVTVAAGVPTIWNGLYHDLKQSPRDISCIRALVVGGSAMPRSLIEAYEKELGVNVVHAWGMTEMSPLGTVSKLLSHHQTLPQEERWDVKARQGYPISGVDMRIMDDAGQELPWDGETLGELQVRGPWVAQAYYKLEGGGDSFTQDGWFRTGDVVTISADGFMSIADRTKDLVKSGGEWISSVELENLLMAHPQVLEAAVIAVPDERWGERPLAVIVPTEGGTRPGAEELRRFMEPQVARWWLPDGYEFIDEIPKTGTGKFDKKVLREHYGRGDSTVPLP